MYNHLNCFHDLFLLPLKFWGQQIHKSVKLNLQQNNFPFKNTKFNGCKNKWFYRIYCKVITLKLRMVYFNPVPTRFWRWHGSIYTCHTTLTMGGLWYTVCRFRIYIDCLWRGKDLFYFMIQTAYIQSHTTSSCFLVIFFHVVQ